MMTVRQYAAHRGVSRQAVLKAISVGRIQSSRSGQKHLIDPAAADAAWSANTDPFVGGTPWMERVDPPAFHGDFVLETATERAIADLVAELLVTRIQTDSDGREFLKADLVLPLATLDVRAEQDTDPVRRRFRRVIAEAARSHIDLEAIRRADKTGGR